MKNKLYNLINYNIYIIQNHLNQTLNQIMNFNEIKLFIFFYYIYIYIYIYLLEINKELKNL